MRGVNLLNAPVGAPLPRVIRGEELQAPRRLTKTRAAAAWLFDIVSAQHVRHRRQLRRPAQMKQPAAASGRRLLGTDQLRQVADRPCYENPEHSLDEAGEGVMEGVAAVVEHNQ